MKTLGKIPVTVQLVDELLLPDDIRENTFYFCKEKMYIQHNCLCGCGTYIALPINCIVLDGENNNGTAKHCWGWNAEINKGKLTVTPSILNHPCEGHYIITNGIANIV